MDGLMSDGDDPLRLEARPYRGRLSAEQLAEGMTAANHNAARLLGDALSLQDAGRHVSATALAILAVEETAKEEILRALATWPAEAKVFWRAFESHKQKGDLAAVAWLDESTGIFAKLAMLLALATGAVGQGMDHAKWRALYVDCLESRTGITWWRPELFDANVAGALIQTAQRVVSRRVIRGDEVRILIKHVAPVAGGSWDELNQAQARYIREVVDLGLRPQEPWMKTRFGFDPWRDQDT